MAAMESSLEGKEMMNANWSPSSENETCPDHQLHKAFLGTKKTYINHKIQRLIKLEECKNVSFVSTFIPKAPSDMSTSHFDLSRALPVSAYKNKFSLLGYWFEGFSAKSKQEPSM